MHSVPCPQQLPLFAPETRACRLCKTLLPLDCFSWKRREKGQRDQRCKACMKATCAARYKDNPQRQRAANLRWRAANPERHQAANKAYAEANRERKAAQTKAWRAAHPERHRANGARWRAENRERQKANIARWEAANPERRAATTRTWQQANAEHVKAVSQAWRQANPGRVAAFDLRRRHRIAVAGRHYTGAEWEALKAHYDYRCLMCGQREPDIKLTFDHVIPVTKGGTNDIANGQPLCGSCNSHKHDKVLDFRT